MKLRRFLFPMVVGILIAFVSCEEDGTTESCNGEDLGEELCTNDFSAVATFCSDGENLSYYTYGGNKYECTGIEANTCGKAQQDILVKMIEEGCETAKKSETIQAGKIELTRIATELLDEVRCQSLCN